MANKRAVIALLATLLVVANARSAGVKVEAYMTNSPDSDSATWFLSNITNLFAVFKTTGIKSGDKVRGVLIADDVGEAAPPNTKITEKTLTLQSDTNKGEFDFSNPPDGWPLGKYHFELYVNGELATKVSFAIRPAKIKDSQKVDGSTGD